MQSKRRVIVGWRQVPVQKIRSRASRPAAAPAVGVAALPRVAPDVDDESGEVQAPELPGRPK